MNDLSEISLLRGKLGCALARTSQTGVGMTLLAIILVVLPAQAQEVITNTSTSSSAAEIRELRTLVRELQEKVAKLERAQNQASQGRAEGSNGGGSAAAPAASSFVEPAAQSVTGNPESPATPQKPAPAEPFAFADWTWLNGNPRTKEPAFDSKFFTPEIRADVDYIVDFNHPQDDTIGGSSEVFRSYEVQLTQLGVGGDFHFDNVHARLMTQFGMYAQTTPRNDASPARGQWNLDTAYR